MVHKSAVACCVVGLGLIAQSAGAAWVDSAVYTFDGANPLADSGPGGKNLTPIGTPDLVSSPAGNAYSFLSTKTGTDPTATYTTEGLYTTGYALDIATDGLRATVTFKAGNDQVNPYPRLVGKGNAFYILLVPAEDKIRFSLFTVNAGKTVEQTLNVTIAGADTFFDDQWHTVTATYDPLTNLMSLAAEVGTTASATVAYPLNSAAVLDTLVIGTSGTAPSGINTANRGLNGEIDSVQIQTWAVPAVPEPAMFGMMALGMMGLLCSRSMNRR